MHSQTGRVRCPVVGLDPIARREIRDLIIKMGKLGKTLFICSHELSEVEMVCDRIGIIHRGKLIKHGKLLDLILQHRTVEIDVSSLPDDARKKLEAMECGIEKGEGTAVKVRIPSGKEIYDILEVLKAGSADIIEVKPQKESLEELFIRTVKEEAS